MEFDKSHFGQTSVDYFRKTLEAFKNFHGEQPEYTTTKLNFMKKYLDDENTRLATLTPGGKFYLPFYSSQFLMIDLSYIRWSKEKRTFEHPWKTFNPYGKAET